MDPSVRVGVGRSNETSSRVERGGAIESVKDGVNVGLELLERLRQVNNRLRGPAASSAGDKSPVPEPNHLEAHIGNLHQVLKACHGELSETFNILGI